jgi:nucleoside-triphosphatase THEP1
MRNSGCQPVLVVGSKNSGKTTYMQYLTDRAIKSGLTVGGFLCVAEDSSSRKEKYSLLDTRTGQKKIFATKKFSTDMTIQYGKYYFHPEAIQFGHNIIQSSLDRDIIMLDEYGPLEKQGKGFRQSLEYLLEKYNHLIVIAVRPILLPHLLNLLKISLAKKKHRSS